MHTTKLPKQLLIALSIACLINTVASAQIIQPERYEKEQRNADDYFHVISLKEEGLALFRERDKYKASNKFWELITLDTTLHEKKTVELEIKERYKLIGYEVVPSRLYLLYRTGETTKSDFELIEVNPLEGETARWEIKPDLDFKLTHFSKVGDNFVFGGYVNNDPAIFIFAPSTKLIKVVPGFFQKDTELIDLRINLNNTFNTVMIDRGTKGERKLTFKTFDDQGKTLLEDVVPIEENRTLQNGLTSTLEREELLVFGNWGEKNSKQSKGFFTLPIDPFSEQKIQYYNFGSLDHYLDYLSPKRAQRLRDATKEDEAAGKIPSYSNYVMPYRILENKTGYIMLAEVYTPNASTNPYYSSPYYYNPYYYNMNPMMGYGSYYRARPYQPYPYGYGSNYNKTNTDIRTNEAVLIAFDGKGNPLWDFNLKLDQIDLPSTEQATDFCIRKNVAYMLYKKEHTLKIKRIEINDDASTDIDQDLRLLDPADDVRSDKEAEGGIRYWYGDSFYVWGYQTIRNATKEDRVRDVFFVNKVQAK